MTKIQNFAQTKTFYTCLFASIGHCAKTWFIFKRFLEEEKWEKLKWLIIVDDDTLLK